MSEWAETERLMISYGSRIWPDTYSKSEDEDAHMRLLGDRAKIFPETWLLDQSACNDGRVLQDAHVCFAALSVAKWVHGGCRILSPESTTAAALAFTKMNDASIRELRVPFPSFALRLPTTMTAKDGGRYCYAIVTQFGPVQGYDVLHKRDVSRPHARIDVYQSKGFTAGDYLHRSEPGTIGDLAESIDHDYTSDRSGLTVATSADEQEILRMSLRIAIGCMYIIQHTKNWKLSIDRATGGCLRDKPPRHRVILIGKPMKLDLRQAVVDVASGDRSAPNVQVLVRGHYKRQVIGIGRSARKVVWIEPYWRGPEDAPIMTRPYAV